MTDTKVSGIQATDTSPASVRKDESGIEMHPPGDQLPEEEVQKIRSKPRMIAVITALLLALFIAALDQTIMATAAPTISQQFHSSNGYIWIGGANLLGKAAATPIWAKLSDIWGRKLILLLVAGLFFCSSIISALSINIKMLIAGRVLQGVAGGGLMQLVYITISDMFSMRVRSLLLGLTETMWAIAGGAGPLIGGAFTEYVSWRWCFWINLPITGLTFILILLALDVHNPRTSALDGFKAIDWFGTLSILGLTLMLLLGLDFGGAIFPWNSPTVICLIVFGALMSVFFIYSEKRLAKYPLMPTRMFKHKNNIACLLVCFVQGMVFIAGEYYLPLMFQSVLQKTPLQSGLLILPITVTEAVMGIVSGLIMHRTGRYRELIWVGLTLLTIGNGLYISLDATSSIGKIVGYQLVAGVGAGMLFQPPLIALQAWVSQEDTATATATFGFILNLGTSASIVIGGVVFQNGMSSRAPHLRAAGLSTQLVEEFTGPRAASNVLSVANIPDPTQQRIVKEAFAWSLRNMWILYTCLAALGLLVSLGIHKAVLSKEHTETKTGLKKEQTNNASERLVSQAEV